MIFWRFLQVLEFVTRRLLFPFTTSVVIVFGSRKEVRDARGVWRRVQRTFPANVSREDFERACERAKPTGFAWSVVLVTTIMLVATAGIAGVVVGRVSAIYVLVLGTIVLFGMLAVATRLGRFHPACSSERVALAWLTVNRCPSCANILHSAGDAGIDRVCSECGGVWRGPMECWSCGYALEGLHSVGACPECGEFVCDLMPSGDVSSVVSPGDRKPSRDQASTATCEAPRKI